jgi:serine phosphatase RsbU (regulator of sigma subunit)/anti-sigma regulatory factor (Ser/Thr protein kinase)/transposase
MALSKKVKTYTVPSEFQHLSRIRDFAVRNGEKFGFNVRQINGFKLSLDEICTNIIRYAYRDSDENGEITIEMSRSDGKVVTKVIDSGVEFDYDSVLSPDLNRYVRERRKGGFGIYMVRQLNDEVHYSRQDGKNVLTLVNRVEKRPSLIETLKNNFTPSQMTIKVRFAVISTLIITCITVGAFYLASLNQKLSMRRQVTSSYVSLLRNFARSSGEFMLSGRSLLIIEQIFELVNEHPAVSRVTLIDRNGSIVADSVIASIGKEYKPPPGAVPLVEQDHLVQDIEHSEAGPALYVSVPVTMDKTLVGKAFMMLDREAFSTAVSSRSNRLRIFLYTLLFWGVGIGGISLMVNMFVTPIKKIAEEISRVGREGTSGSFHYTGFGEFAEISTAFNRMMHDLRESEVQLTDQARLRREMQLAQGIQQTLLPKQVPSTEGFDIAARYDAAMEVGGDYYDFFHVDEHTLGIVVGDVSGKGIGGAFMMSIVRTALRLEARGNRNAAEVLNKLNQTLDGEFRKGMYITLFYIVLDSRKRVINYASAGHTPMILYRADTDQVYRLNPKGFPIGLNLGDNKFFKKSVNNERISLNKGDLLLVYTDGITEAMNPEREEFGEARLLDLIRTYKDLSVDEFSDRFIDEIKIFTRGYAQNDDITFIVVKEKVRYSELTFDRRTRLFSLVEQGVTVKEACRRTGISTSTYYRLKKLVVEQGMEALKPDRRDKELEVVDQEVSGKILAVVRDHPEYSAQKIGRALKAEEYGSIEVDSTLVARELRRLKLSNKEKRLAYVRRLEKSGAR